MRRVEVLNERLDVLKKILVGRDDERVGRSVRANLYRLGGALGLRALAILFGQHRRDRLRLGRAKLKQPQRREIRLLKDIQTTHMVRDDLVLSRLGDDEQAVCPLDHRDRRLRHATPRIDRIGAGQELTQRRDQIRSVGPLNIDHTRRAHRRG